MPRRPQVWLTCSIGDKLVNNASINVGIVGATGAVADAAPNVDAEAHPRRPRADRDATFARVQKTGARVVLNGTPEDAARLGACRVKPVPALA